MLPEEPPGARCQDVVQDGPAACALPCDGHPGGVTPEVEDVLLDPVEGELLVPDTLSTALTALAPPAPLLHLVTRHQARVQAELAQGTQAVVHRHDHQAVLDQELGPVHVSCSRGLCFRTSNSRGMSSP